MYICIYVYMIIYVYIYICTVYIYIYTYLYTHKTTHLQCDKPIVSSPHIPWVSTSLKPPDPGRQARFGTLAIPGQGREDQRAVILAPGMWEF